MPLLNGRISAHNVEDIEGLARRVLDDRLRRWGAHLRPELYDDAVTYLIAVLWECSEKFDTSRGVTFSTYAYRVARLRVVDWYRAEFRTTRWQSRRDTELPLSLDAAGYRGCDLGELVTAREGDPADRGDPALARLIAEGRSSRARDLAELARLLAERAA